MSVDVSLYCMPGLPVAGFVDADAELEGLFDRSLPIASQATVEAVLREVVEVSWVEDDPPRTCRHFTGRHAGRHVDISIRGDPVDSIGICSGDQMSLLPAIAARLRVNAVMDPGHGLADIHWYCRPPNTNR